VRRGKAKENAANHLGERVYQSGHKKEDYTIHGTKDAFRKVISKTPRLKHLADEFSD
jgi:hypothetical protein